MTINILPHFNSFSSYTHTHAHTYVSIHIGIYTHTHKHVHIHVYTTHSSPFLSAVSLSMVSITRSQQARDPLLRYSQKVKRSLTLCHNAMSFTSLHLITQVILSSHVLARGGECSTRRYFEGRRGEGERPHSQNFYYSILS